jgi:arylsulfatase A-like enzyme
MLTDATDTFPQVLRNSGYDCGYIGKWHLDSPEGEYAGPQRGDGKVWDGYVPVEHRLGFTFWNAYNCYDNHFDPHYWRTDRVQHDEDYASMRKPGQWSVEYEVDVAIDYLKNDNAEMRSPDKPFALFVANNPPHMPFNMVPDKYREPFKHIPIEKLLNRPNVDMNVTNRNTKRAVKSVRDYFAMIHGIDENFGRLMKCLEQQGLADDTIVVFTSDHGEMMGSHNRMHKGVWYAESFGIPLIIRYPGKIEPCKDDLLICVPDMMPSLLALLGLKNNIPDCVEGTDLSAAIMGDKTGAQRPDSVFYFTTPPANKQFGNRGLKTQRYTFAIAGRNETNPGRVYLYDDLDDPYQLENIAKEKPEVVKKLTKRMHEWMDQTGDTWER